MKASRISLADTGQFSGMFLDYIHQEKKLEPFYKYLPVIDSFSQAIKDISAQKFNRRLLVDVIVEQYANTSNCQVPSANCQLLLKENTYTVCTGHQLCLFTGPLYFIYKIITTINLAEELKKKYPENNFVPVFWMASEDHDFEEVNHINLPGHKLVWQKKQGGPLGKYAMKGISVALEELRMIIGDSRNAAELMALFSEAYEKHSNYAAATRYLVNELFGKYGLVIIDADDRRLKNEIREIIRDDIFNHTSSTVVSETVEQLKKAEYDVQVIPKDINYFILSKNYRGRIDAAQVEANRDSWKKKLEEEIERFSPNVVTRPLYQQKILPNLAYVGGPAEIAYWLEYKALFDHYKIPFPVLIPRNFVHLGNEYAPSAEMLQERFENFIPYYIKKGSKWLDEVKKHLHPFDFQFNILSESE
jgi:bacillithiol biosynthesis cysteine-adding enzyme BshC